MFIKIGILQKIGGRRMNEWINQRCKIFVRNLSDKPIIYTGTVLAVDQNFLTILDKTNNKVSVNISDIIQIKEEEMR